MRQILVVGLMFFFAASNGHAHSGAAKPSDVGKLSPSAPLYKYLNHSARAGYGYLATSEAEAATALDFSCDDHSLNGYLTKACGGVAPPLSETSAKSILAVFDGALKPHFEAGLRRKVLERSGLQLYSMGRLSPPVSSSCVDDSTGTTSELSLLNGLPPVTIMPGRGISESHLAATASSVGMEGADRLNVVANQLSDESLASAIVLAEYYQNAASKYACSQTNFFQVSNRTCRAINKTLYRLRGSYPAIFTDDVVYPTLIPAVRPTILGMIEALRGEDDSVLGYVKSLVALSGGTATTAPIGGPAQLSAQLAKALRTPRGAKLSKQIAAIRADHAARLKRAMDNICTQSIAELIVKYPAVVRQYLIDSSVDPAEQATARIGLCSHGAFQMSKDLACGSIFNINRSVDDQSKIVQWFDAKVMDDYPFACPARFALIRLGGSTQVVQTINVIPSADSGFSPAMLADWEKSTNQHFNSEAVRLGKKVQFNIKFTIGNENPSAVNVRYHRCWCSTCLEPKDACRQDRKNQADSGNLHSGIGLQTVMHEVAHGMGLPDEYVADYYPFNSVGEPDSLMHGGTRLYPRHLDRIINPNRCD